MTGPNPYRSPRCLAAADGERTFDRRPGSRATLVQRGLLYRKLDIQAPVEATLEFHGRGLHDQILINGQVVADHFSWWRITPRLEFCLPTDQGPLAGQVDIRVWPWLALRQFHVTLGGQNVYSEGRSRPRR